MERPRVQLSPGLLICLAATVLMLPIRWIIAWILAVCVHELGHLAVLRLLRLPISAVEADTSGTRIRTVFLAPWQEVLCALSGPAAGMLLLFAAPVFPRLAVCGGFHSLYNLLPVYPLDGGRCIRCLAGEKAGRVIQNICLGGILVLGVYGTFFLRLGLLPLFFAWFTVIRALAIKIPCKAAHQALQ